MGQIQAELVVGRGCVWDCCWGVWRATVDPGGPFTSPAPPWGWQFKYPSPGPSPAGTFSCYRGAVQSWVQVGFFSEGLYVWPDTCACWGSAHVQ